MMKKTLFRIGGGYETPTIEIHPIAVEGGFALSEEGGQPDDFGGESITDDSDSWN